MRNFYIKITCLVGFKSYQISQNQITRKPQLVIYYSYQKKEALILKTVSVVFFSELDS